MFQTFKQNDDILCIEAKFDRPTELGSEKAMRLCSVYIFNIEEWEKKKNSKEAKNLNNKRKKWTKYKIWFVNFKHFNNTAYTHVMNSSGIFYLF